MSNIDAQIKALQLKKKKIDYIAYVADLVKNDTKCIDFKDVRDEVVKKITPFLKELAESIEKDVELKSKEQQELFTSVQLETLKSVADSILNKKTPQPNVQVQSSLFSKEEDLNKPQPPPKQKSQAPPMDKMNFAISNRHLADKRVQVINDTGVEIFGKVVGLDAPFVHVKTDTGPTIQVPLEKVVPK